MGPMLTTANRLAVAVGAVAALAPGMVWFGPIFGTVWAVWASGSHDITPPA